MLCSREPLGDGGAEHPLTHAGAKDLMDCQHQFIVQPLTHDTWSTQALLEFLGSGLDISKYWAHLEANSITKERLLSYDRCGPV